MKNLRIVLMNGGLGNQLFQYTFIRFLELCTKENCIVDDAAFDVSGLVEHNGYELEKIFGIKLNRLSNYFSEDVWKEMMYGVKGGRSVPQQLLDNGMNLVMLAETSDYRFEGNIIPIRCRHAKDGMLNILLNAKGNIYYHGYYVSNVYWTIVKEVVKKELQFPPIPKTDELNRKYAQMIRENNSVSLHIRRGDFVKCGRTVSPEKYARAIRHFDEAVENATFFVFSDDIPWCKEEEAELGLDRIRGEVVYVTNNVGNGNNYIDMQLMSMCKNMIISNSSFGIWASLLNENEDVKVVMADNM